MDLRMCYRFSRIARWFGFRCDRGTQVQGGSSPIHNKLLIPNNSYFPRFDPTRLFATTAAALTSAKVDNSKQPPPEHIIDINNDDNNNGTTAKVDSSNNNNNNNSNSNSNSNIIREGNLIDGNNDNNNNNNEDVNNANTTTNESSSVNKKTKRPNNRRKQKSLVVPHGFWHSEDNRRQFFDDLGRKLGFTQMDDWYTARSEHVFEHGGGAMLQKYYGESLFRALTQLYPHHDWDASRFVGMRVSRGYWKDAANQRRLLDRIGEELGVKQLDDWYHVRVEDAVAKGAKGVLSYYGSSLSRALVTLYPEHPWRMVNFARAGQGYWKDLRNQRRLFDEIAKDLGVKRMPDDWYAKVHSVEQLYERGARALLIHYYNGSLARALEAIYPEHAPWDATRFAWVSRGHWKDPANHRRFFDTVGREHLGIKHLDDWYGVKAEQLFELGGSFLLRKYYGASMARALTRIYPEHDWQLWRFPRTISEAVNDDEALRRYVDALAQQLHVRELDDWYRVSLASQLRPFGGYSLIARMGGLPLVLKRLYPDHPWDEARWAGVGAGGPSRKRSSQRWLYLMVANKIFPGKDVIEDYLHPDLCFQDSQQPMQLDVFVPELSLAFEYQGEQHFGSFELFGTAHSSHYHINDNEKVQACRSGGVSLVSVPYWWDRTPESLVEMIRAVRPDLILDHHVADTSNSNKGDSDDDDDNNNRKQQQKPILLHEEKVK